MVTPRALIWILAGLLLPACSATKPATGDPLDAQQWRSSKSRLYQDLALQCLSAGDHARAQGLLEQAVQFNGGKDARTLEMLARVAYAQGDLVKAGSAARMLLQANPDSVAGLCTLGAVAEAETRTTDAEAAYRRAIAVCADDPRPALDLHRLYVSAGRDADAERVRTELLGKFPNRVEVWLDQGAQFATTGRWSDAAAAYRRALDVQPDNLDAAARYAASALACDRPDAALALGRELPPRARVGSPTLGITLATAHLRARDYAAALAEIDLMHTPTPGSTLPILRGEVLVRMGRLDEARDTLEAFLARDPGAARAHATLGGIHLHQGRPHAAVRALQAAARLEPENGITQGLLAASLAAAGDAAAAAEHLRRARGLPGTAALVAEIERLFPVLCRPPAAAVRR